MTSEQRTFTLVFSDGRESSIAAIDISEALRKTYRLWVARDIPRPTTIRDGTTAYRVDLLNTRFRPADGGDWTSFAEFDTFQFSEGSWTQGDRTFDFAMVGSSELFDRDSFIRYVEDELSSWYYRQELGVLEEGYVRRIDPENCLEFCEHFDPDQPCGCDCFFECESDDPGAVPVWIIPFRQTGEVNP